MMEIKRVLLICSPHLLGESVEQLLRRVEGMELFGPWEPAEEICPRIPEISPDVIIMVEDQDDGQVSSLTAALIESYPELPVIRARLTEDTFRVFSTHLLPASAGDLVQAIRSLPTWEAPLVGKNVSKGDGCNDSEKDSLVYPAPLDRHPGPGEHPGSSGSPAGPGPG